MSFKAVIISTVFVLLSGNAMAGFVVGNNPSTHSQAAAFCAQQGSRLADVNQANRNDLIAALAGKPGWIASWDSNFYTGTCTYSINNHIGPSDCNNMLYPVCNPVVNPNPQPCPHPHHDSSSHSVASSSSHRLYKSFNAGNDQAACGPRRSRSSRSSASSFCADSSVVGCEVPFQYVYLTNTITNSFTSTQPITTTTTSTEILFFATVAAYTVTPSSIP